MECLVLTHGMVDSNTYILSDEKECAVIDCGVKTRDVMKVVEDRGFKVKAIILTHGHFDHIFHVAGLKAETGADICIHEADASLYRDPETNGFNYFGLRTQTEMPPADILLKDGQKLRIGKAELEIIHTPGHTPGSICIKAEDILISGDTLFSMSVGRTDLPGGSQKALVESIREKLFTLDPKTVVYPGHGPQTTIGHEVSYNPYV